MSFSEYIEENLDRMLQVNPLADLLQSEANYLLWAKSGDPIKRTLACMYLEPTRRLIREHQARSRGACATHSTADHGGSPS